MITTLTLAASLPALLAAGTALDDGDGTGGGFDVVAALEGAVTVAIDRARPSVVTIDRIRSDDGSTIAIRGSDDPQRRPFMPQQVVRDGRGAILFLDRAGGLTGPESVDYPSVDFGSGVVIGDRGEILTTHHRVVGAARLIVRAPGLDPFDAEIVAADPRIDLAVIAPARPVGGDEGRSRLEPIPLGDASEVRVGSFLVALGNAHNTSRDGEASASFGILANTARRLLPEPGGDAQLQHYSTLLQLDSKLNVGISGGAVVNLKGELVGITTATADAIGYDPRAGYAIPLDTLGRRVVAELREGRAFGYGFLGVSLTRPTTVISGPIQPGSPAGLGGLRQGDRIAAVEGGPTEDFDSLIRRINAEPAGRTIALTIERDGQPMERSVVLSKYPVVGEVIASDRPPSWRGARVDFSSVAGAIEGPARTTQAMAEGGVGIVEVQPGSAAEAAGLRPGQILSGLEGRPLRRPADFFEAAADHEGEPVRLTTNRGLVTVLPSASVDRDD